MISSPFDLKVLKNTPENIAILIEMATREPSKEFHILLNDLKVALVQHYIWSSCCYCTYEQDEEGIIDLR